MYQVFTRTKEIPNYIEGKILNHNTCIHVYIQSSNFKTLVCDLAALDQALNSYLEIYKIKIQ